jgi:hypothetical protein
VVTAFGTISAAALATGLTAWMRLRKPLVAPVSPDVGSADNGVIAVSVTAVITGPITIAISRIAIAITGIPIGRVSVAIPVSGVAVVAVPVTWITVAVTIG